MLIGLNGRKQAGKDTVYGRASRIMANVAPVERVSFADLLYRSAAASLGVSVPDLQRWKTDTRITVAVLAPNGRVTRERRVTREQTIREYLQHYGTESHRHIFGDNFWVDQVDLSHTGRIVMVTDVRFENEAIAVRRAGGHIVEVVGPEGRVTDDGHASEKPLPACLIDFTLPNIVRGDDFATLDRNIDELLTGLAGVQPFDVGCQYGECGVRSHADCACFEEQA